MPAEALAAPVPQMETAPVAPISGDSFKDFDDAFPDGLDSPPDLAPSSKLPDQTVKETDDTPPKTETEPTSDKPKAEPSEKQTAPATAEGDDEFTPPQVAKPSELRGWALRMGKKAKAARDEASALQARVKALETAPPKQLEDNSAMAQELANTKKRLESYEQDLRMTRYERSQEYKDKFEKPYKDAVSRAYREVKELLVYEPNTDDPENPKERIATPADFDEIYNLPLGPATRLAKSKFGDAAAIVMQHRQQIKGLSEQMYNAVEEYKAKGSEYEKQQQAQSAQHSQGMMRMFSQASEAYVKKAPELFLPRDGDTEGNDILQKSKAFADAVFGGNDGLTPQQVAMKDARAHSWLTAYPRLARDVKKLRGELTEATKTIESLRGSGPGKPKATTGTTDKKTGSWQEDFDALPE